MTRVELLTARVAGLVPDPGPPLRQSDKAVTLAATLGTDPVVVKIRLTDDPYWTARFAHERAVYEAFRHTPPGATVPAVHHADDTLLVVRRLPGAPPCTDRYPPPLPEPTIRRMLDGLAPLWNWRPPPGPAAAPAIDVAERLRRDATEGWLSTQDAARIDEVLAGARWTFAHGDPLVSNYLDGAPGAWIDFEHAGFRPPLADAAMLAAVLSVHDPSAPALIAGHVTGQGAGQGAGPGTVAAFAAGLNLALAHERRLQRRVPGDGDPAVAARLTTAAERAALLLSRV